MMRTRMLLILIRIRALMLLLLWLMMEELILVDSQVAKRLLINDGGWGCAVLSEQVVIGYTAAWNSIGRALMVMQMKMIMLSILKWPRTIRIVMLVMLAIG